MKILFYIPVLFALVFFSCKSGAPKEENVSKNEKKDSLIEKLNSPELKAVNEKLRNDPNNAGLYHQRARIYISLKQFEEAAGDALRAMNLDSTKAEHYVTLADVYFATNKTRYSKQTLEAAVKKFPTNTEALLKLAELFYLVRQYENSITYINKALKLDENIAKAYYLKGSVYKESGDTAKAISSMITAVEQDNKYFEAFVDLGILYASRKNPVAFEYFDNALRVRPNDINTVYAKAKLLQDLGKTDEAVAIYEEMLKLDKNNPDVLYNLGAIQFGVKKDAHRGIDYFTKALAVNPQFTEAYFARGVCFENLKDFVNARADYNQCLQITKNYEPAIEAINALEKSGKK